MLLRSLCFKDIGGVFRSLPIPLNHVEERTLIARPVFGRKLPALLIDIEPENQGTTQRARRGHSSPLSSLFDGYPAGDPGPKKWRWMALAGARRGGQKSAE